MNDRLLLIALSEKGDKLLDIAQSVTDSLMRRFRKDICIERISSFLAGEYCRNANAQNAVETAINKSTAILMTGCAADSDNLAFCADAFAKEFIIDEKSVITPLFREDFSYDANSVVRKTVVTQENLSRAAQYAFVRAKKKHTGLCICASSENLSDESRFMQNINELAAYYRIDDVKMQDLWNFTGEYDGKCRTVFADEKSAVCVVNILGMKKELNDIYVCFHTENMRFYEAVDFFCERNENLAIVRLLDAVAAILENEFKLKNEAQWLRRAVYTAAQTCIDEPRNVYLSALSDAINDRMRQRREGMKL